VVEVEEAAVPGLLSASPEQPSANKDAANVRATSLDEGRNTAIDLRAISFLVSGWIRRPTVAKRQMGLKLVRRERRLPRHVRHSVDVRG
jgi:hypothetical protein